MVQFTRAGQSSVYPADGNSQEGSGWLFVAVPSGQGDGTQLPAGPLSLSQALTWTPDAQPPTWRGCLVYLASGAGMATLRPDVLVHVLQVILDNKFGDEGGIVFLPSSSVDPNDPDADICVIPLSRQGTRINPKSFFTVLLTGIEGVSASFNPAATLSVPDDEDEASVLFEATTGSAVVTLIGPSQPVQGLPQRLGARLRFDGLASGAFVFDVTIAQSSLLEQLNMGFQVVIPNSAADAAAKTTQAFPYLTAFLPLAEAGDDALWVGFTGQVNVMNPNNRVPTASQTAFFFTGKTSGSVDTAPTELVSNYRTNFGKKVILLPVTHDARGAQPARLVINPGSQKTNLQNGFRFSPQGDFMLAAEGAEAGEAVAVLCGASGTETITFLANTIEEPIGQRIRFRGGMPANAPAFPLNPVSPIGPPMDPHARLLDDQFQTSWASFLAPSGDDGAGGHYASAPKGAELFGVGGGTAATGMLEPKEPGVALPPDGAAAFPMMPLAGFVAGDAIQDMSAEQLDLLLRQIIGPVRKNAINASMFSGAASKSASSRHSLRPSVAAAAVAADDALTATTTPTGFIARYDAAGQWKQLLLAQVMAGGAVSRQMGFTDLDDQLQAAFQTTDQFLVVANGLHLGPLTDPGAGDPLPHVFMPPSPNDFQDKPRFFNRIDLGQWSFSARPGTGNDYGDYRNVMIVKGVKGKILDVDSAGVVQGASLLKSPDKWTMREVFASPDPPDMSELVPLSDWLVDYCLSAWQKREDPYFAKFASILSDPGWTGVLFLKANVAQLPDDIAGILSGVKDPTDFYAHHVGIDIGQIDGAKVQQRDTSSMFALVHYIDPRYDDSLPPHTIPPLNLEAEQDFTLLTLKALFENSAVKKFDSLAQMVLNSLFGASVTQMIDVKPEGDEINGNHAVLLEGGIQRNSGATVYSLASTWPNRFVLANNVLTSVEIDTAEMSMRDNGATSGMAVSWIGMTGFMNFAVVPGIADKGLPDVDFFSYGPESDDGTPLRKGLNFANFGLRISSQVDAPQSSSVLELVETELSFNSASSHARDKSLFRSFQLELLSLVSGDAGAEKKTTPASLGYLTAVTQYGLRGIGGGRWHGLNFKLNLGTPGALAGKVNLDSSLLLAWADDSGSASGTSDVDAMVGIQLPGAGGGGELFSLQTVLKLSVGLVQLFYAQPSQSSTGGFLLAMNQIALKFLGLLQLPPSGNTAFMLFGDPKAGESSGLGWFAVYNKAKE